MQQFLNTLTKRFHRDEKISLLMLSSSVVCLSFTSSKNKKGIIKILVYISVIDINQIDVLLRLGAICVGGSHVLIGLLEISHKNGIFSLFTGKYNFQLVLSKGGEFALYFWAPPWGICSFSKTKWQMPDKWPGGNWLSHNVKKKSCSRWNSVLQFLQIKLEGICLALAGTFLQKQFWILSLFQAIL